MKHWEGKGLVVIANKDIIQILKFTFLSMAAISSFLLWKLHNTFCSLIVYTYTFIHLLFTYYIYTYIKNA